MKRIAASLVAIFFLSGLLSTVGAQPGEDSAVTQPRAQKPPAQAEQKAETTPESSTKAGEALAAQMNTLVTETLIDSKWPLLSIMKFIDSRGSVSSSPKPDSKWAVGGGPELIVSPDGKRVAYWRSEKKKEWVVSNGKEEKVYDGVDPRVITFSPDSKRLAYFAKSGENWMVVVDGKEGKQYEQALGPLVFSPDSQHLASVIRTGKKYVVIVDEKEGRQYDDAKRPRFSPNSQHLAYVAEAGKRQVVVMDGKEGSQYDGVETPVFSPDSQHLAYAATEGKKAFIVLNGVAGKGYDEIVANPIFSPDGKRVAYAAKSGKSRFVVLDGKEQKQYAYIYPILLFSPDSQRLAYWAKKVGSALSGHETNFVMDGKEEEQTLVVKSWQITFESFGITEQVLAAAKTRYSIVLSPDGKHVAHVVGDLKSKKQFVVLDGAEQSLYDEIFSESLRFSPDSSRFAYVARTGKKPVAVVDGKEGKQYEGVTVENVVFSPDSKHFAYVAVAGEFNGVIVIDGKESSHVFYLVPYSSGFGPADTFHYLATKPTNVKADPGVYLPGLFLVEEKIK